MLNRFRIGLGFTLLAALFVSVSVSAKGGFAFITISGADFKEPIRAADGKLTHDFFAFADFYQNKTDTPADPGLGYEITRYYIENSREIAFDKLHYYPETGFVFYDGIVSGSSEYDGKWYTANPRIKTAMERFLPGVALPAPSSSKPVEQKTDQVTKPANSGKSITVPQFVVPMLVTAGLTTVLLLVLVRRKHVVQ